MELYLQSLFGLHIHTHWLRPRKPLPPAFELIYEGAIQGVTKRCRLSWLTNSALVYEPKCGGGVAGSQTMSTAVHKAHGAQINFGELTPYLSYGAIG
jgi:hypothetical protein